MSTPEERGWIPVSVLERRWRREWGAREMSVFQFPEGTWGAGLGIRFPDRDAAIDAVEIASGVRELDEAKAALEESRANELSTASWLENQDEINARITAMQAEVKLWKAVAADITVNHAWPLTVKQVVDAALQRVQAGIAKASV